ncbi:hypothetical protein AVEN_9486-1 [Araneus ventricosus]|uniref:Uncharacterized protein n=1 Tax=Araneus ventricosus TaxID=182803 RepID=A0A4Y2SB59_ARAVE|nr:hypothetical protein AVEN_9486-1 [Araneus ventricosus]
MEEPVARTFHLPPPAWKGTARDKERGRPPPGIRPPAEQMTAMTTAAVTAGIYFTISEIVPINKPAGVASPKLSIIRPVLWGGYTTSGVPSGSLPTLKKLKPFAYLEISIYVALQTETGPLFVGVEWKFGEWRDDSVVLVI